MTEFSGADRKGFRSSDYVLLILICVALYFTAAVSGRPLSMHEGRLPELAREMVRGKSDWILPQSGGRPWLERPPLPHWFTAGSMLLFGRTDALWVSRVPAAMMGLAVTLLGAGIASRWFGREIGLLSGAVLATTYEVYQYATLAEDDIYLAAVAVACVAVFVRIQWPVRDPDQPPAAKPRGIVRGFIGGRDVWTMSFFVLLGLTNLAKGPLVGAMPIIAAIAAFLLWSRDVRGVRRYAWLWGWLIFIALTLAWPWWARRHYPDVVDNWRFDYLDKAADGDEAAVHAWDEAWWYYLKVLPLALAPWTWATVIGLLKTARRAFTQRLSAERFLWCWAICGLVLLSVPARKHHHYLVPIAAPWAILGAIGFADVGRSLIAAHRRRGNAGVMTAVLAIGIAGAVVIALLHTKLPGGSAAAWIFATVWFACVWIFCEGVRRGQMLWLAASIVAGTAIVGGWLHFRVVGRDSRSMAQLELLRTAAATVPPDEPIYINADVASLEFFRLQFGLHHAQVLLHNLTFLRDPLIRAPAVYVITRAKDERFLRQLGQVDTIAQAVATAQRPNPADPQFTLFRLRFAPDLQRIAPPRHIGVLEAMGRKPGPWAGDPPVK